MKFLKFSLLLIACNAITTQAFALQSETIKYYTSKVYKEDGTAGNKRMYLNLHRPDSCPSPRPFVLFIHGGGFENGSRNEKMNDRAIAVANQGFVTASMSYRLVGNRPNPSQTFRNIIGDGLVKSENFRENMMGIGPVTTNTINWVNSKYASGDANNNGKNDGDEITFYKRQANAMAAAIEDLSKALIWARNNAGSKCINVNRISVVGESAGAITAMNLIYPANNYGVDIPRVHSIVNIVGANMHMDLLRANSTPVLSIHGTNDNTVPHEASVILHDRAQDIGMYSQFISIPNGAHTMNLETTQYNGRSLEWHILNHLNRSSF